MTDAPPERIIPDDTEPGITALHLKRYEFALPWCDGRDVLDAGCGVGYGSAFLATTARSVVGIDDSEDAVDYAQERYARPNVEFELGDVQALDRPDSSFDVVCAFEVIEHLADQEAFIREARRVLRPGGTFLLSTPMVSDNARAPKSPHHTRELAPADLEGLLGRHFDQIELYGQRRLQTARHRLLQRLDVLGLRRRATFLRGASRLLGTPPMAQVTSGDIAITRALDGATEVVAVCR